MSSDNTILVFVHGWSVTNLDTYGQLPVRLQRDAKAIDPNAVVKEIYLGQYISFHDEVQLHDISRAFETAVREQLSNEIANGNRFICITHSTGGPVIREWFDSYYNGKPTVCPMSHLIMLAPANFGSALAQLGKGKIGRLKSWLGNIEPGQGVLNWLELGSNQSWALNEKWIKGNGGEIGEIGIFPFTLIGQSIDRAFYDNLNSYTGEIGSDGVVRCAAANLNASYVSVKQGPIQFVNGAYTTGEMAVEYYTAPQTAFRLARHKSHSGKEMGILASPKDDSANDNADSNDLVGAILSCIRVKTTSDYDALIETFEKDTENIQLDEKVEKIPRGFFALHDRYFIHDRFSMVIFRIHDSENYPITDYDLLFTAGDDDNPNHLPEGFFSDRQQNSISRQTVTYFVNYDVMNGCAGIQVDGNELRPDLPGAKKLGLTVRPRPDNGFVRYMPFSIQADETFFKNVIKPNSSTLIDICLQRIVDKNVAKLNIHTGPMPVDLDFHKTPTGNEVAK